VEALLEVSGMNLPVNPVFILRMGKKVPGSYTAEDILAAHAAHVKACEGGGGSMTGQHGGNIETGYTPEQHAKACAGRASMHEDAINIMFAHWDALPRTWRPIGSYTATKLYEPRMIDHVLSCYYRRR
jgi:hypothetical protein